VRWLLALGLVELLAGASLGCLVRWRRGLDRQVALELRPPDGAQIDLARWVVFFQRLFGIAAPGWRRLLVGEASITFGYVVTDGVASARCWCPQRLELLLRSHLGTAVPGIDIRKSEDTVGVPDGHAARTRLSLWRDHLYPLATPKADVLDGVLAPLLGARSALLQLTIQPDVGWQSRAGKQIDKLAGVRPSGNPLSAALAELLDIFFGSFMPNAGAAPDAIKRPSQPLPPTDKAFQPAYRAALALRVVADSKAAAKGLMHAAVTGLRALDGENGLRPRHVWVGSRFDRRLGGRGGPGAPPMLLTSPELAHLFHLPVGGGALESAPVRVLPSRPHLGGAGKVICLAEDERQTAITLRQRDARQHTLMTGPTGSGKSVEIANLVLDDVRQLQGVAVIDPKGDLVRSLLERIPPEHADRVVLIDPTLSEWPVGLNVLSCPDPELRELVCDQVVTVFRKNYERYWGPRTDDVLRAAVLTLMRFSPNATLCDVPTLLLKEDARRRYRNAKPKDPAGLDLFWHEYERMGETARLQMVGPLLNKLRSFLMRRTVRNIIGQPKSTIDIPDIIDSGKILLVSLPKGLLGEETSRLLGSFIVARIWQAAMARADRPEEDRRDFNLYLDEFHNYLNLPQNIDDLLVEARGYCLSLILAHQHLGQLNPSTLDALAANARTRIVFQCGHDEAVQLAKEFEPWLSARNLQNLQRFQIAARVCINGRTEAAVTGITRPLPESLGAEHAARIAQQSMTRYGRQRELVEQEMNTGLDDRQLGDNKAEVA
jgi:Type IV secretion-system coupling protein DNA-binding domain